MANEITLQLTEGQFTELYSVLLALKPEIKDPTPDFTSLCNLVIEKYELEYARYALSPAAQAFCKIYPDDWIHHLTGNTKVWQDFKLAHDRMSEMGMLSTNQ